MTSLKFTLNPFHGAVIDTSKLPDNTVDFTALLSETISILISQEIKVVWLSIPIEKSLLISVAVEAGFIYHHAGSDYLELTLKLVDSAYVPPYATHYIGAGGVVLDEDQNLLIVCEKYRVKYPRHYKLPGGTLNQGEHISDAVCREVLEETGIKTEFQYLTAFRHWHGYRYGKSDIYFVSCLKPLNRNIVIEQEEIEEALWMPVNDYLSSPETHPFNRKIVESALSGNGMHLESIEGYGSADTHEILFQQSMDET